MSRPCVVIAGGGTGGHIYPGLAIAKALQAKDPQVEIHFVGTPGGLENKIVPREGYPLHLMQIGKLNHSGGLVGKLRTLLSLPVALLQSVALLFELKPVAVLGVGGYASGPFVLMACLFGFRSAIWEPNAHPGLTNRWLSRFVRRSFVVFSEAKKGLRSREIIPVGMPIRQELDLLPESSEPPRTDEDFHVLIFGGSQGARTINNVVREAVLKSPEWRKGIRLVHQTGSLDFASISESYKGISGVEALEYLHDMHLRYQWADLVICRAGASTVAEIAASRRPALLIPLPWAADDHQRKNAESLAQGQAGVVLLQSDLTADRLIEEILRLKKDTQAREAMRQNLKSFHRPRAAETIATLLLHPGDH